MATNGIDFNYAVKDGKVSVSYTDKDGKTQSASGKDAASIFIQNGYSQAQADQIISDLLNSASYDKNSDSILSDEEIQAAFAGEQVAAPDSTPNAGATGSPDASGGVDPNSLAGEQPNGVDGEKTEKNQYWNKSNAELASTQGDAQKNYDSSKEDMDNMKTGVEEAKNGFQEITEAQDNSVQEAKDNLDKLTSDSDKIKADYGEDIAKALDDVKAKQTAEDEAQAAVNEKTTAVADATTAVSDATSAVDAANTELTAAQAALDSAPMFVPTGETDENGNPVLEPNGEIPALQEAVSQAEAKVAEAEQKLAEAQDNLTQQEEALENAEKALETAKTERDESQKTYDEVVSNSEFAEDAALKAISDAVHQVSQAQDARTTAINEAQKAVIEATANLKTANETFKNNQQALHDINREVNTRKAKGIWDPSSDKTPDEIEAEENEKAEKAEEEKETEETEEKAEEFNADEKDETEKAEGEEAADGQAKEELPTKGNAEDLSLAAKSGMVTYAMVKDELKLAEKNNVNLKDYVYAKGQDGVYHLYHGQTGKSIAREYGENGSGLNVWGGGYDIVGNGSGYLNEFQSQNGEYKTVYYYGEQPDTVKVAEKQYNTSSPLSFDLDGNGVGTTDEMISYDIDGDGIKDNIFNSADAVLVFDKDGDGISGEDGSECFGDNTDLDGDGKADGYKDGFEALKALANKENLIGDNDSTLDEKDLALLEAKYGLKIKAGGYNSEAVSLSKLGISDINLAKTNKTSTDYNFDGKGNELMHQQGATFKVNGVEREYADLWHRKFGNKNNFFK